MNPVMQAKLYRDGPKPDSRKRTGFTGVEVIIALALGTLVIGIAIGLLTHAIRTLARTGEQLDARESAHVALVVIRACLIDATMVAINPAGPRISFQNSGQVGEISADLNSGSLSLRVPGQKKPQVLISKILKNFNVREIYPGLVQFTLEIDRPRPRGRMAPLGALKVVDAILVPCIGLQDYSIPWHFHFVAE